MSRKRAAILISGRGANMEALIKAASDPTFPAQVVLVLSNRADAAGLAKAEALGISTKVISHKDRTREDFDAEIDTALRAVGAEIVCEAGFMRIHSEGFARAWEGHLLNVHPSLLPAFKGVKVHEQALAAGVRVSGCTVHFIVPELDSGPIIEQAAVRVFPGDTAETLAARILEEERRIYPEALRRVAEGKVRLENGRAVFQ